MIDPTGFHFQVRFTAACRGDVSLEFRRIFPQVMPQTCQFAPAGALEFGGELRTTASGAFEMLLKVVHALLFIDMCDGPSCHHVVPQARILTMMVQIRGVHVRTCRAMMKTVIERGGA